MPRHLLRTFDAETLPWAGDADTQARTRHVSPRSYRDAGGRDSAIGFRVIGSKVSGLQAWESICSVRGVNNSALQGPGPLMAALTLSAPKTPGERSLKASTEPKRHLETQFQANTSTGYPLQESSKRQKVPMCWHHLGACSGKRESGGTVG